MLCWGVSRQKSYLDSGKFRLPSTHTCFLPSDPPEGYKRKKLEKTSPNPSCTQIVQSSLTADQQQGEPAERKLFRICSHDFSKDAPSFKTLFPQATTLVTVAQAGRQVPFDVNSPLRSANGTIEVVLERMGVCKGMSDEISVQCKMATEGLGIRCSKLQVPELKRWVARALAVKYCQGS